MKMNTRLRTLLGGVALLVLAGCAGGSASDISLENPDFFLGRVSDSTMSGAYNPNGFTAEQVQQLVLQTCDASGLSGFETQADENGLTNFSATCNAWKDNARAIEYQRSSGSNVVIEITGASNGNLSFTQYEVSL